jgi:uncharacterized protein YndB with AHSA1/START domain
MPPQESAESMPTLEISRRFDAPPERVFDAWVSIEWGEWLAPADAVCKVTAMDPRAGGHYSVNMSMPDGRTIEVSGMYREVSRPKKLVFTWRGVHNSQEMLITLTFEPDGAGTVMSLRQEGFPTTELRQGFNQGWNGKNGSFDKLDRYLANDH